jgi:hypothetical protein
MAKLSAHGYEIGTIEYLTFSIRFMSDGNILRNNGGGWKLYKKMKEGFNVTESYNKRKLQHEERLQQYPLTAMFEKALHRACGVSKRGILFTAIEMMPDDPDGIWSEVCDSYGDNVHASIEEIVELCRLYKLAMTQLEK